MKISPAILYVQGAVKKKKRGLAAQAAGPPCQKGSIIS